jgi:hypothetical protein
MTMKPGLMYFVLIAAGTIVWVAILLVVLRFHQEANTAAQLAFKAQRVELVSQMRLDLASASEAEKSAVMATTDQASQAFADQARAATAAVDRGRGELEELLQTHGKKNEEELLAGFSQAFVEFQRIGEDLLGMAVQNTNLKAYSLAFGPAAEALDEVDAALSRIVAQNVNSGSPDAKQVIQLADDARIRALHIQTLLAPHIAEESGRKMDELEALMAKDDAEVHKDLAGLAGLLKPTGSPDLEIASSRYAQFSEIRTQIIQLSRENTNVRSLVISLNQERKVMLRCQDALGALEQAIRQESVARRKMPVLPR